MKELRTIPLADIVANPHNPRENFSGRGFDELVASIRKQGVVEPVIVRPMNGGFELVAGERRLRASREAETGTIPAVVQDLTDEEALDVMTVENLHREDLSEYEEAKNFKEYIQVRGEEEIPSLAERIGVDPRYVRRRVRVLTLPHEILKAWEEGALVYGHLEQLLRLDPGEVLEFAIEIFRQRIPSVNELRMMLNNRSKPLARAAFNRKKAGCGKCNHNSAVQGSLFGDDFKMDKASCLLPSCFIEKQRKHFLDHWPSMKYAKEYKTPAVRFADEVDWGEYRSLYTPSAKCLTCEHFFTIIRLDGGLFVPRACFNPKCKEGKGQDSHLSGSSPKKTPGHGELFREAFYAERIPSLAADLPPDDLKVLRLTLVSLMHCNFNAVKAVLPAAQRYGGYDGAASLWEIVEKMDLAEVKEALRKASLAVTLQPDFGPSARHRVASHLGVDLQRDWTIHEEYLKKKTIKEILSLGHEFGIFEDEKAKAFLQGTIKAKSPAHCKKTDLIRLVLESGVNLAGKVPKEILEEKKN